MSEHREPRETYRVYRMGDTWYADVFVRDELYDAFQLTLSATGVTPHQAIDHALAKVAERREAQDIVTWREVQDVGLMLRYVDEE